jgi:hypothetical protein
MRRGPVLIACGAALFSPAAAFGQPSDLPVVPGFVVAVYARLPHPADISIDHCSGTVYAGRDEGPGGADPTRIHRILPGRRPEEYGPVLSDPDAVLFDGAGSISGIPGAVLVGDGINGTVWVIPPTDPSQADSLCSGFLNVSDLALAPGGSLVAADENGVSGRIVKRCPGEGLWWSVEESSGAIAIDRAGRIYTRLYRTSGDVLRFAPDGTLDGRFSGFGPGYMLFVGRGGRWGESVYANNAATGELLCADHPGGPYTVVGTGFQEAGDAEIGPDGALYMSHWVGNRILRIAPEAGEALAFADGEFADGEWELSVIADGDGGEVAAHREAAGGNPDAYRRVANTKHAGSQLYTNIFGFHWRRGATYDPRTEGAVQALDYFEEYVCLDDGGLPGSDCQATGIALRQGGETYIVSQESCYIVTPRTAWTPTAGCTLGLTEVDFVRITLESGTLLLVPEAPDFSRNGAPIDFGFYRANSGHVAYTTIAGIDNWRVVVHRSETPSRQLPGDCNQDGVLDISDAVCVFRTLFTGDPARFPCGDGSPGDPGNRALLDWHQDGAAVNVSDGIALLQYYFRGGPPHRLGVIGVEDCGCVVMPGCPDSCGGG